MTPQPTKISYNLINLKRRKDRLDQFFANVPQEIKHDIKIFEAVEFSQNDIPEWWTHGIGAYGCYHSHLEIIKNHINTDYDYVCIFEDDAIFTTDFYTAFINYIKLLPQDADQFYIGGQYHKLKPIELKDIFYYNAPILRTHSYLLKTSSCSKTHSLLEEHFNDISLHNHIDHIYVKLQNDQKLKAYSPKRWLCGQSSGYSDIAETNNDINRWWYNNEKKPKDPGNNLVLVLGVHGSGSSCVATILQKLGIFIGSDIKGHWAIKGGGGGGEDSELAKICESIFMTPAISTNMTKTQIINRLNGWITSHRNKAKQLELIAGCKYPTLCSMSEYFKEIIENKYLRIVHCNRPLEDSINSMIKRGYDPDIVTTHQKWLYENKIQFLSRISEKQIITINFNEMISNPNKTVYNLINFLEIDPSDEQIYSAINHVKS